jgi:hypothetical protein
MIGLHRVLQKKCVNNGYCHSPDSDIPTPRKSACIRPSQRTYVAGKVSQRCFKMSQRLKNLCSKSRANRRN